MANKNDEMILVIPSKPFADTKKADITEADKALAISEHYEASMSIPEWRSCAAEVIWRRTRSLYSLSVYSTIPYRWKCTD